MLKQKETNGSSVSSTSSAQGPADPNKKKRREFQSETASINSRTNTGNVVDTPNLRSYQNETSTGKEDED